jgi:5,10-methylenetetrahydromethanopterin reductase
VSATRDTSVLGAYLLPGNALDPRPAFEQARAAEELGLGTIWLSERWGAKDLPVLFGALSQVTTKPKLAAGTLHFQDRHPLLLASTAATLQAISDGRFVMGVGKAATAFWHAVGLPQATNELMSDSASIVRRLLRGETVTYDGPAGSFPGIRLMQVPPGIEAPPILLAAIGPRTLDVAGRDFDGVILHPFLTPDAVRRSAERVRAAAEAAGRDPASVRIVGSVVVASDLPQDVQDEIILARVVTYIDNEPNGTLIIDANDWDRDVLAALRNHPLIQQLDGYADMHLPMEQRIEVGRILPEKWLRDAAAIGTPEECARKIHAFLDAGADEMILHGSTPDMLQPVVQAFTATRPS